MWAGRHVVLGVSGGIASYKSCILARRLTQEGARVDVALTRGATEFIRPLTFEALTGRPVLSSLWEPGGALSHVRLGQEAHLIIVAPATAHLIARVAQGLAEDLLTTLLLARTGLYKVSAPVYGRPPDLPRSCPVVASFGGRDVGMRGAVEKLTADLAAAGVPHDVKAYPDAGHSFFTRTPGLKGRVVRRLPIHAEYHEPSAQDAHRRVVAFFKEHLANS